MILIIDREPRRNSLCPRDGRTGDETRLLGYQGRFDDDHRA